MKNKKYYCVERWNREKQKWNRFSYHDSVEKAKESAEHWTNLCNRTSRVIEVKEKMVARFISKVANEGDKS